jgi:hypothetical protein
MADNRDAYDTVRNLRPLPQSGSDANHPALAGRKTMADPDQKDPVQDQGARQAEACMKLLLQRFPHVQALALKRCGKQDSFQELCEEYRACNEVLERLERPGAQEELRTEYGALRLRLEGELLRYIAEESSRAGNPKF